MHWKIREAKPEDFDAINELVGQLYSIHAKNRPDIYRPCDKPLDYDYYISMLNDDNVKVFIGEDGDRIIAYTIINFMDAPKRAAYVERRYIELDHICVSEEYRGNDIGSKFIDYIKGLAKSQQFSSIELHVAEFNEDAIGFYEAKGFKPRSRTLELPIV
ncbi:GNAT family N-acetyltransferase [Paenibacillus sp. PSB04]|uniref:GNAT family N-acetyltransferase n=1 Tax=Paenibacillus sp. PSB04 TaxID=2866810 RepID=UPI0021F128B8|nr:GNAT family N-acetyltransferase [Paenibacillus sp. PSB04]UYO02429.1 GNAT family N-acetyltransferase [Paenibacillus sp. PSB04]